MGSGEFKGHLGKGKLMQPRGRQRGKSGGVGDQNPGGGEGGLGDDSCGVQWGGGS